jgi:hypothetical protein
MKEMKLEDPWLRQFQWKGYGFTFFIRRTFVSSKLIHLTVFVNYLGYKIYVR